MALSKEKQAAYFKAYYEAHEAELLAWQQAYQEKHRQEILARVKAPQEKYRQQQEEGATENQK